MSWKEFVNDQAGKYILEHIKKEDLDIGQVQALSNFWGNIGPLLLNEVEWQLDDLEDAARNDELASLLTIIETDTNIDTDDENVQRIIVTIKQLQSELEQEVEYENPDGLED